MIYTIYINVKGFLATHSSILAWKISWTEEPGGLQSKSRAFLTGGNSPREAELLTKGPKSFG